MPRPGADDDEPILNTTVQLIRYLRGLAQARREPVRDVSAYEQVHWLAELPGEVYVETDAAAGDVLFSVPVIPITPPAALEEFDGWLGLRRWYRTLRSLADLAGGEYELVLATGLLTWQSADGVRVRNHLLATPVAVVVDPETERVDVLMVDRPTSIADRRLLDGLAGFRPARTDWVRDAVRSGQGYGLQNSAADVLRKWCTFAFEDGTVGFREDWTDDQASGTASKLRLAPALVLRGRDHTTVVDYYDAMLTELIGHGAGVPAGLAHFVTGAAQRNLAYVPDRGPRVVADLLVALLARGQRVLVTSSAAAELVAELPAEIAPLCATPATARQSLSAMTARFTSYDPERQRRVLAEQESRLATVAGIARDLREQVESLRAEQTHDLAPGYTGTVTELTQRVAEQAGTYSWLPVDELIPQIPPLTAAEMTELLRLLAGQTPERAARGGQSLPELATLPDTERVETLVETERTAAERVRHDAPALSQRLVDCDAMMLQRLDGWAAAAGSAFTELGLPADPQRWDPGDWTAAAVRDGLASRTATWDHVRDLAGRAVAAEQALRMIGHRRLTLPPVEPVAVLPAARELLDYLSSGGGLRRGPLRPSVQKNAEPLLTGAFVDGAAPVTAELLQVVIAGLDCRAACQELLHGWRSAGVTFPAGLPLADTVGMFAEAYQRLSQIRRVLSAVTESASLLLRAGLQIPLSDPAEWQAYAAALADVRPRQAAVRATAALTAVEQELGLQELGLQELGLQDRAGPVPPELTEAAAAIAARDVAGYGRWVAALARAHQERAEQLRCDDLLARVRSVHPRLASLLAERPEDPAWAHRLAAWEEAWAWAYASVALRQRPHSELERQLEESLQETADRQTEIFAGFTAEKAWGWCLSRMTARPDSASVHTLPALAMPLWQVPEALPPQPDSFDVVIVDEGAGEPVEALFLLWLAARVIIVGSGTAPTSTKLPGALPPDAVAEPFDEGLSAGLLNAVGPSATLFEALEARFGPVVGSGSPTATVLETPVDPVASAASVASPLVNLPVRPGRSIVEYKRTELIELIQHLAESGQTLSDDQLLMYARTVLDCPADEELLTSARLRYALEVFRAATT